MKKLYTPAFKAQLVQELLKETKTLAQLAAEHSVHPNVLREWKLTALRGLPILFEKTDSVEALRANYEQHVEDLYAQIGRLTTQVGWLKKNLASTLTRVERVNLVERERAALSLKEQADLLSLSRRSLYYKALPPSAEEVRIKHAIDRIYTAHLVYGSRRIEVMLERDYGLIGNRKAVQRHMREMGIAGISPEPNLSKPNPKHRVYPYRLRGMCITHPNQVWAIDITYIPLAASWLYLVAILDVYTRYIISWALDDTLELPFVLDATYQALTQARPEICTSDQGSHFTRPQYTQLLEAAGVQISMDGKGRALDTICIERLWRSVKYEDVYLRDYRSPRDVGVGLSQYIKHYNEQRLHSALQDRTPAAAFFGKEGSSAVLYRSYCFVRYICGALSITVKHFEGIRSCECTDK